MASGTQVRNEDFGLLFYTMKGPRLYFLSSGALLDGAFFNGGHSLEEWLGEGNQADKMPRDRLREIKISLDRLKDKGVIIER